MTCNNHRVQKMYKNRFMALFISTTVDVYYFNSKKLFLASSFYTDIFSAHTSPYVDEIFIRLLGRWNFCRV